MKRATWMMIVVCGLSYGQMLTPRVSTDLADRALVKQAREFLQRMRETTDHGYADRAQKLVERRCGRCRRTMACPRHHLGKVVPEEVDLVLHTQRLIS